MKALLLLGAGGHCRACIDVIEAEARYQIAGVVQPPTHGTEAVLGYPILGSDDDLPALLAQTPNALITVGQIKSHETRKRLFNLLKHQGANLPVIQSPTAYCSRHDTLGEGSILMHGAVVNANATTRKSYWRNGMNSVVEMPWPRVIQVTPLEQHRLSIVLATGEQWLLDLDPLIQRRDIYWRLRQDRYFQQVEIDPLGALYWPEGEDLAPESLSRYRCH